MAVHPVHAPMRAIASALLGVVPAFAGCLGDFPPSGADPCECAPRGGGESPQGVRYSARGNGLDEEGDLVPGRAWEEASPRAAPAEAVPLEAGYSNSAEGTGPWIWGPLEASTS